MPKSDRGPAPSELYLVLNWFGEVTARARSGSARPSKIASHAVAALWSSVFPAILAAGMSQTAAVTAETGVRETLQRYSAALESLDASAVKKVQPSIPVDNLARAFRDMRELKVAIDAVRVLSLDGTTARVSCRVTQILTPKVGSRKTTAVNRVMRLKRDADAWVIDGFER